MHGTEERGFNDMLDAMPCSKDDAQQWAWNASASQPSTLTSAMSSSRRIKIWTPGPSKRVPASAAPLSFRAFPSLVALGLKEIICSDSGTDCGCDKTPAKRQHPVFISSAYYFHWARELEKHFKSETYGN